MEFKHEELVESEVIIARLLLKGCSEREISEQTGMGKRIVAAHIRNMKVKLHARDLVILIRILQQMPTP
jgi:DNA-binding NarL/FixJ family response regulator